MGRFDREHKAITKAAIAQGWRREETKKGFRLVPPDKTKQAVQFHGSPSDINAVKAGIREMKKQGFIWP